jgi:hypothetical protein
VEGIIPKNPHPRSDKMKQHIPEESSTGFTGWPPSVIMGETAPPRDPDDDDEEDVKEENDSDEPPFVREPDEN